MREKRRIGCVLMASGSSSRYGKNKLLESLGEKPLILHAAGALAKAGEEGESCDPGFELERIAVTRSPEVQALLKEAGVPCFLHHLPRKSDTMHAGLQALRGSFAGFLFMPGDQPLVLPSTLKGMILRFLEAPNIPLRLSFGKTAASPVLFPASMREKLMSYEGEKGGRELLGPDAFETFEALREWELWDADTPEGMERIRAVYSSVVTNREFMTS